jgi:TRAP-type C4-dicarboxylate transport system permease small subunit
MKTLDKYLGHFLAFLMALMLLSVCWQVITRYFLASPSTFSDELARYLLIWIGTLGAAYVSGQGMHLNIDLLPSKLEGKARYRLQIFIYVLVILFVAASFVIGGLRLVYITYSLGQTSAAMQLPLAYVYMIIPVSGVLIVIYKIRDIINLQVDPTELSPENNPS